MPILTANGFFQGFNFDTLLSLISCVTGVVALFLGGAAYNQCRIIKNSFNDKKEFRLSALVSMVPFHPQSSALRILRYSEIGAFSRYGSNQPPSLVSISIAFSALAY